jgi:hypothetical protein
VESRCNRKSAENPRYGALRDLEGGNHQKWLYPRLEEISAFLKALDFSAEPDLRVFQQNRSAYVVRPITDWLPQLAAIQVSVASAPWAIINAMKHQLSAQRVVSAPWQGQPVSVSCRMVSRYGWTSASIDVAVGDQVVLRTGGVAKLTGEHTEQFEVRGTRHVAGLRWGRAW